VKNGLLPEELSTSGDIGAGTDFVGFKVKVSERLGYNRLAF
jgi:hypothetical protein